MVIIICKIYVRIIYFLGFCFSDFITQLNREIAEIILVSARHTSTCVILLVQNLFDNNKFFKLVSQNSLYIFLLKNPRATNQFQYFARQIMPKPNWLINAYKHVTKDAYSYMLLDMTQTQDDKARYRSRIFRSERPMCVYLKYGDN